MNITGSINQLDEVLAKEITIDLSSGNFYKEVDDETLKMALTAMYENIDGWNQRGVIIGREGVKTFFVGHRSNLFSYRGQNLCL